MLIAGKSVVVAGYGSCGKGFALRSKGMGAKVIVTEVDPFRALQAKMDGFDVMPMHDAVTLGDLFLTVTGNCEVIRTEHFRRMKDGAIVANSGHFDIEVDVAGLTKMAKKKIAVRPYFDEFVINEKKSVFVIAEGRLANLAAAEGHPSEVMSMSFCGQFLAVDYLVKNASKLSAGVHLLPSRVDEKISKLQLQAMEIKIDKLTDKQKKYLGSWQEGT
jgi:adenosylhomocysteinase